MIGLSALSPDMMFGGGEDELMGGPAFGDVLRAVEWQESRGRDDAVSPKGAFGAMQLMPGAVMDYARAHGLPTDPGTIESLRRDPAKNREIGAWYLEQVQGQFGGDIVPALAAYNAGPGRVKQILAGFGGEYSPEIRDEFISRLPAETRGYIASIENRLGQPQKPGAPPMPYDEELAPGLEERLAGMSRNVTGMSPGGAGIGSLQPSPARGGSAGLSALSLASALDPYMQLARQIGPQQRSAQDQFFDALGAGSAAMLASGSPHFGQGLGQMLGGMNTSYARGRAEQQASEMQAAKLGFDLYKSSQRDDKPMTLGKGGVLVDPRTGRTIAENPDMPPPKIETVREGSEIVTYERNAAGLRKEIGRGPAFRPDSEGSRLTDFQRKLDVARNIFPGDEQKQVEWASNPRSLDPSEARRRAATLVARDPTIVDKAAATKAWERFLSTGDDSALTKIYAGEPPPQSKGSSWLPWNWFGGGGGSDVSDPPASQTAVEPGVSPEDRHLPGARPSASGALPGSPPPDTGFGSWAQMRARLEMIPAAQRPEAIRRMRAAGVSDEQINALTGGR